MENRARTSEKEHEYITDVRMESVLWLSGGRAVQGKRVRNGERGNENERKHITI